MAKRKKTRLIEYYRLWPGNGGDSGTWDTDFMDVPFKVLESSDAEVDAYIRKKVQGIKWREEPPVIVGLYCRPGGEEEDETEPEGPLVTARAHSDDYVFEIKDFDIRPWLMQASENEILDLAKAGWGNDYCADEVAQFMADYNHDLAKLFEYLEQIANLPSKKDECGFECEIHAEQAMAWLDAQRCELAAKIRTEVEGA